MQLIDFSTYRASRPTPSPKPEKEQKALSPSVTVETKLEDLRKLFPGKHHFTIREASDVLPVSYETIRRAVKDHRIYSVPFCSVNRIQIETLAELLVHGIPE